MAKSWELNKNLEHEKGPFYQFLDKLLFLGNHCHTFLLISHLNFRNNLSIHFIQLCCSRPHPPCCWYFEFSIYLKTMGEEYEKWKVKPRVNLCSPESAGDMRTEDWGWYENWGLRRAWEWDPSNFLAEGTHLTPCDCEVCELQLVFTQHTYVLRSLRRILK